MARKKANAVKNMHLDEVSFVDRGMNPGAHVLFWKRRSPVEKTMDFEPRSFDEVMEDRRNMDVLNGVDTRLDALSSSIFDILISDSDAKSDLIQESIDQFMKTMETDVPKLMSGELVKAIAGERTFSGVAEVFTHLTSLLSEFEGEGADDVKKNAKPDLSKLDDEVRGPIEEYVKELVAKAEAGTALVGEVSKRDNTIKGLETELAKLKKVATPVEGTPFEKMLASMPEEARPFLKAQQAELEATRSRLGIMEKATNRADIRKDIAGLKHLTFDEEKATDLFEKIGKGDTYTELVRVLKAADAAVEKGGLFDELGSGAEDSGGSAYGKLEALAKKMVETDSDLTFEAAFTKVLDEHPALYREYNESQN